MMQFGSNSFFFSADAQLLSLRKTWLMWQIVEWNDITLKMKVIGLRLDSLDVFGILLYACYIENLDVAS